MRGTALSMSLWTPYAIGSQLIRVQTEVTILLHDQVEFSIFSLQPLSHFNHFVMFMIAVLKHWACGMLRYSHSRLPNDLPHRILNDHISIVLYIESEVAPFFICFRVPCWMIVRIVNNKVAIILHDKSVRCLTLTMSIRGPDAFLMWQHHVKTKVSIILHVKLEFSTCNF